MSYGKKSKGINWLQSYTKYSKNQGTIKAAFSQSSYSLGLLSDPEL